MPWGGGVYRSRTGDFCIANAALWPSELIPRIDRRSVACKDIAYFRFGIPRTEEIFFTGKSLFSDLIDTHAGDDPPRRLPGGITTTV